MGLWPLLLLLNRLWLLLSRCSSGSHGSSLFAAFLLLVKFMVNDTSLLYELLLDLLCTFQINSRNSFKHAFIVFNVINFGSSEFLSLQFDSVKKMQALTWVILQYLRLLNILCRCLLF